MSASVIVTCAAAPNVAPSIEPPLMSAVVKTEEASVTTPVEFAIDPAAEPSFAFRLASCV
jgi:hypothetical protein